MFAGSHTESWALVEMLSSGAHYAHPAKIFFTSKFSYVLFCNPTNKTETGTANRWETTNSKPHGPIIYDGPIRNTQQQLDHIYYNLFCTALLCLDPPTITCAIMMRQNHFPESNRYKSDFLHPFLTLQDHILSTAGDALRSFEILFNRYLLPTALAVPFHWPN